MADTEVREILSSFAAGCLDKENFIQFKKYLESGGELPKGELGELQNLISLIPTILETEKPPPILKNKLAKNLVRIQREKTQTKTENKKSRAETPSSKVQNNELSEGEPEKPESSISKTKEKAPKETTKEKQTKDVTPPPIEERKEKITDEFSQYSMEGTTSKKKTPLSMKILLTIFILLAAASITLNILWKTDYENEVTQLRADIASLNAEVQVSGKFVTDYKSLIEFLNQPNVTIVNLRGSDFSPQTTGKVFFGFENNQLLIEIKNPKTIQMNETLQLWVTTSGSTISLGTFNYNPSYKFLEIKNIPDLNKNSVESVRITVEPRIGSDEPTGPLYLSGSL